MATFTPASGIGREIARSAGVRELLAVKAARVLAAAKSHGAQVRRSGHYAAAFDVRFELHATGWEARVVNTDFKAGWIEFGTKNNQKQRVLGRALDAARA